MKQRLTVLAEYRVLRPLAFLSKQRVGAITKAEAIECIGWWIENFGPGFERRLGVYLGVDHPARDRRAGKDAWFGPLYAAHLQGWCDLVAQASVGCSLPACFEFRQEPPVAVVF